MRYPISDNEQPYLDMLRLQMPSIIGAGVNRITKTTKFEENYSSRVFKQPLIIKKINKFCDYSFRLTFRQFLRIENGEIVYTPTPLGYINNMLDDAILKFRIFKSFSYKNCLTLNPVISDGFSNLKFDLILDVKVFNDSFNVESLQVKGYYGLTSSQAIRYLIFIKDKSFLNQEYYEIRYTPNGDIVASSGLCRFIKIVESIWEHSLDFYNLDVDSMKTTTDMLLI